VRVRPRRLPVAAPPLSRLADVVSSGQPAPLLADERLDALREEQVVGDPRDLLGLTPHRLEPFERVVLHGP